MHRFATYVIATAIGAALPAADGAVPVRLAHAGDAWQLSRDGRPWTIRGAGGDASMELLASIGGNTCRTWGAEGIKNKLDEAQRRGLGVVVGIWLGHERHGFRWDDQAQVDRQFAGVREQVMAWKDHPAVLAWGVGNEMEGFGDGGNQLIWQGVERIAAMVKSLDPAHPTLTTVAEIGGRRVELINRLCPSIDIVGINSYGGCTSIPARYRAAGGTKPYVVTEYGPPGTWELPKNPLGAVDEPTSTAKGAAYRAAAEALAADRQLCLGSIAFAWGSKIEATATWYGMILPDGSRLAPVDVLADLWGRPVPNRVPRVDGLAFAGGAHPVVKPGTVLVATLGVTDPEGDPLTAEWALAQESSNYNTGGDHMDMPPTFPEAIQRATATGCELRAPEAGGTYRLYATVRDGKGGAANGSLVFKVDGPALPPRARKVRLPALVAGEAGADLWAPSGYMGDTGAIRMEPGCTESPKAGTTCLKVSFAQDHGWGGVVWQSPANDWGEKPGGFDLNGAQHLRFWVRGAAGGERVKFGFGLIGNDKPFGDSAKIEREVELTAAWQEVDIPVSGRDLSRIKTGFMWTAAAKGRPFSFCLDEVRWE